MASKLSVFLVLSLSTLVNVAISQDAPHPCDASISVSITVGNAILDQVPGRVGIPLILTCNVVPSSANVATYTWLHNGQILKVDTSNTLTLNPLTIADGGVYRCRSVIRLNQNETCQTEYSRTLTVTTPPRITSISPPVAVNVEVGQSFRLSCDAVGYPQPTFEWYKTGNEQEILSQAALYSVLSVNLSHSGVYVCRATNSRANVTDSVNVAVRNPPPPTTQPETPPETTTIARPTTQSATSNITRETPPTASSTGFYIGVAVISAVAVIFTALTALCFFVWVCYSVKVDKTVAEPSLVDEEMTESQEAVDIEELIEEAAFEETIGTPGQEIIPQPVKKKTRGKHHKF